MATMTDDGLTVKAQPQAAPTPSGLVGVPAAVQAQGLAAVKSLNKRLTDALQAHTIRRQTPGASLQEAELIYPPNLWSLALYGPIQLNAATVPTGNPPYDVNKVIQNGQYAAFIAISYADPTTMPPTNMYLAAKDFRARFTVLNLTNGTAGPSLPSFVDYPGWGNRFDAAEGHATDGASNALVPPGEFSISPFTFFTWIFQANVTPGSEGDLYECNFDVDISFPGVPGGGFANWVYDTDSSNGIPASNPFPWALPGVPMVPGTNPVWRYGNGARFMVNNFPG